MSYKKVTIPNLEPGETGIQLDTGDYIAVSAIVNRDTINQLLSCVATVRLVNADGSPVLDDHSQPVIAKHTHATTPQYLATLGGQSGLILQTVNIVLGEPSAIAVADDNIRVAIIAHSAAIKNPDLSIIL